VTGDARAGEEPTSGQLQEQARRHLWMHFTRLGAYAERDLPVVVRGEGCYVFDAAGKRYLDALAGLFTVQLGHGRRELAEAARAQAEELAYFPVWSYAHPAAIRLAARVADLAPRDLNRVFFTTSGSEAVESAWKLARQYFRATGEGQRYKVIARRGAYHGTTLGALAVTGIPSIRAPFEPLPVGGVHVVNTNRYRHPLGSDEAAFSAEVAGAIEDAIVFEGPQTVAAVYLEPVQNAGGCIPPPAGYFQRVREICDRHGVLLISDEVICAFGRLGHTFGCERYDYLPDMITTAKGLTSGYSPLGAAIVRDFLAEPFLEGASSFLHGTTFGGHPVSCAVGLANLDLFDEEGILDHVRTNEAELRNRLESLRDIPLVGDVRGAGYFHALELVKDAETAARFTPEETEDLLRDFLAPRLYEAGLVCRVDDRVEPVLQFSPPLIAGPAEFEFIETTLRSVLTEAWKRVR
jgi:adenosylmethionine-8-amino-7-oxononanoate aminotransferase